MIQLSKTIKVGPTVIPAGTILDDKYESGICYYKGTKVDFDKIPKNAIAISGAISTEAKKPGQYVEVVDYAYDDPSHAVTIAKGRLQNIGTWAKMKELVRKTSQRAYKELERFCKTGRELVWQVNGGWYCHEQGRIGLEDVSMNIVPAETPNIDYVMLDGKVIATITAKELVKASYPDVGYLNSEDDNKLAVLDNNQQKLELKCLDDDIVLGQAIIDELGSIIGTTESELGVPEKPTCFAPDITTHAADAKQISELRDMLLDMFDTVNFDYNEYKVTISCFTGNACEAIIEVNTEKQTFVLVSCKNEAVAMSIRKAIDIAMPNYVQYMQEFATKNAAVAELLEDDSRVDKTVTAQLSYIPTV